MGSLAANGLIESGVSLCRTGPLKSIAAVRYCGYGIGMRFEMMASSSLIELRWLCPDLDVRDGLIPVIPFTVYVRPIGLTLLGPI